MNDEERKRKYNEQREERNAKRRAKYRETHPVRQRRERYTSPAERDEARRQRRIERTNVIKELLNEFRARQRNDPAAVKEAESNTYSFYLKHNITRQKIIRVLVTNYYDELKEQMDAYRLLKDK